MDSASIGQGDVGRDRLHHLVSIGNAALEPLDEGRAALFLAPGEGCGQTIGVIGAWLRLRFGLTPANTQADTIREIWEPRIWRCRLCPSRAIRPATPLRNCSEPPAGRVVLFPRQSTPRTLWRGTLTCGTPTGRCRVRSSRDSLRCRSAPRWRAKPRARPTH
jgi:hypothetical protein